jgi:Cft2 family RNA processing exonuclease
MKDDTTPVQKNSALLTDTDTSASTQRNQILAHLKNTPSLNTLELRALGFISPASRILELKYRGYNIKANKEIVITPGGMLHRGIARYYLSYVPPANNQDIEVAA